MTGAQGDLMPVFPATTRPVGLIIYCIDCGTAEQMQLFNGIDWTNMIRESLVKVKATIGDFSPSTAVFWAYPLENTQGLVPALVAQSSGVFW
jgi:hypothetical protein